MIGWCASMTRRTASRCARRCHRHPQRTHAGAEHQGRADDISPRRAGRAGACAARRWHARCRKSSAGGRGPRPPLRHRVLLPGPAAVPRSRALLPDRRGGGFSVPRHRHLSPLLRGHGRDGVRWVPFTTAGLDAARFHPIILRDRLSELPVTTVHIVAREDE